jgi:hypothetical protein
MNDHSNATYCEYTIIGLNSDHVWRTIGLGDAALVDGVKVVEYGGFVDLVAEREAHQAWL